MRREIPPGKTGVQDVRESLQIQQHDFGTATSSPGPALLHYKKNEDAVSRWALSTLRSKKGVGSMLLE